MDNTFHHIQSLRNMDQDFGMLPYPKLTATQEKYYANLGASEMSFAPFSANDAMIDRTSAVVEAMAAYSWNHVIPEYFERSLKTKVARDDDSARIIDLLFENRVYDIGHTLWFADVRNSIPTTATLYQGFRR
jgi:hypothetical protein